MKVLLLTTLVCFCGLVSARTRFRPNQQLDQSWSQWKAKFDKSYEGPADELLHRKTWEKNFQLVQKHNLQYEEGTASFLLELNKFSDVDVISSEKGLRPKLSHRRHDQVSSRCHQPVTRDAKVAIPEEIDWRKEGYVTEVKNQLPQECLHSVYFVVTGVLEAQWYKKTGNLLTLSEQNIADCCGAGSQQCNGATGQPCSLDKVYQYVKQKGVETLENYPDTRADQKCAYDPKKKAATLSGYDYVNPTEDDLKFAVATIGPIAVQIDSNHPSFQNYKGGVYSEPNCANATGTADRNLLIVGYGTDPTGGDYWIAKNSFGPDWGEEGYIRLSRNKNNQCGVANVASYPFFSCDE